MLLIIHWILQSERKPDAVQKVQTTCEPSLLLSINAAALSALFSKTIAEENVLSSTIALLLDAHMLRAVPTEQSTAVQTP